MAEGSPAVGDEVTAVVGKSVVPPVSGTSDFKLAVLLSGVEAPMDGTVEPELGLAAPAVGVPMLEASGDI